MRGLLAVSIGVTLSLTPLPPAAAAPTVQPAPVVSGSTQSLPLTPLTPRTRAVGAAPGLPRRDVRPFSLLGVVWDDPAAHLDAAVQARTRAAGTDTWSDWQDLETHADDHGADPGTPEHDTARLHGGTAPLWVGDSDGVEVRIQPGTAVPAGLRAELVDPGTTDAPVVGPPRARARLNAPAAGTVVPELARTLPHGGPRPRIVTRKGWGADEKLREKKFSYTKSVKAAFVHHTATGNRYRCSQAASVIRGIYRYHVKSMGWKDIGYNFLVDKCGNIYEGRAGGVTRPVLGAHTLGFNGNSVGIAVIGTYGAARPAAAAVKAVARLSAWKLGIYGVNPRGTTYLKSAGGNLYRKGKNVRLNVISGHRDGFATDCPGRQLYGKLGAARSSAARYQGR
ncbi:N-acetylmuramoyl-L-alanine amidase [Streptomyces roseirectus]|uniref:N-acetylmuramoyl-L-alanine amidase n=1 Tax=Streptomyces roseirectus TaxID=2768066 RepID=A0A7H0IHR7_9ACTN|nr:N-acetylmuramoyl-L-alanine amidase [Streptomyces roseirectus]QNP72333.1 N-acetylmuramoyl-L-alanine amidase [Streptomyces roseirectus]